jgi:hypothetical protein
VHLVRDAEFDGSIADHRVVLVLSADGNELDPLIAAAQHGESLQQSQMVLVRPGLRRIEDEAVRKVRSHRGAEAVSIEACDRRPGDDRHPPSVDAHGSDEVFSTPLGHDHHCLRLVREASISHVPIATLEWREQLGQVQVLKVVRLVDGRHRGQKGLLRGEMDELWLEALQETVRCRDRDGDPGCDRRGQAHEVGESR